MIRSLSRWTPGSAFVIALAVRCLPLASAFDQIVVFGDSLSDDGGDYGAQALIRQAAENSTVEFPGAPYYRGSVFSDGKVWVTVAAEELGVILDDRAVGGATSGAWPAAPVTLEPPFAGIQQPVNVTLPSSLEQAQEYADVNSTVSPVNLYIIFIGGNDFIALGRGAQFNLSSIAYYIEDALEVLYEAGARSFLVPNTPPVDKAPGASAAVLGPNAAFVQSQLAAAIQAHNLLLASLIATFPMSHPGSTVLPFDFHTFFTEVLSNATASGLDTTTPCFTPPQGEFQAVQSIDGLCTNPSDHVFFDRVHPSNWVHELAGKALADLLAPMVFTA